MPATKPEHVSQKAWGSYLRAKAAEKLAHTQGSAGEPLSGEAEYYLGIHEQLGGGQERNLVWQAHQRGIKGLPFDEFEETTASTVDKGRTGHE